MKYVSEKICPKCNINQDRSKYIRLFKSDINDFETWCYNCMSNQNFKIVILQKECDICYKIKNIDNFTKYYKTIDGYNDSCQKCINKDYYENGRALKSQQACRERVGWFHDLKRNHACIDCDKVYSPLMMDFDHIKALGDKKANISHMVLHDYKKEEIYAEIAKCELVCLFCHHKRSYDRNIIKWGKTEYSKKKRENLEVINKFKSDPCYVCGNKYEVYNMQCDHINPDDKIDDICQMKSEDRHILLAELAKCRPICAMCHRQKSFDEQRKKFEDLISKSNSTKE